MQPKLPPDIKILTPSEYAARRKQREATGFAEDERERHKPLAPELRKRLRTNVTLLPLTLAIAKRAGHGTISRGIEQALHFWLEAHPDKRKRAKRRIDVRKLDSGPKMRKLIKTGYFKKFHGKLQGR